MDCQTNLLSLISITELVNIFSKQHTELVLRLNDSHLCFICKELKDGVSAYAKAPARYLFSEYLCTGVSENDNEIYLALESEKLLRILRQINVNQAKSIKFKLTQKDYKSLLEITIEQQVDDRNSSPSEQLLMSFSLFRPISKAPSCST